MTTYERTPRDLLYLRRTNSIYIALEEQDHIWELEDVLEFDQLWQGGYSIEYIADYFGRKLYEVAILIMDRSLKGNIEPRENGLHGREEA